jgi:hypothetical protein
MASVDDKRRQQLCQLYCELVASEGAAIVHRLLSAALIAYKRVDKKREPVREVERKPPKPRGPMAIEWNGGSLALGEAMRRLNHRQQLFVLAVVHDNMSTREADKVAGYTPGGGPKHSPYIDAAIVEERRRDR